MDRLEQLRQVIDKIVRQNPNAEEARCGFVHLYGVSAICTILALKRGLDPPLCSAAGMLHDIWNYQMRPCPEHGPLGAGEARIILNALGTFSTSEIETICDAIAKHTDKESIDGDFAELLKDADVFQHYLYNPRMFDTSNRQSMRVQRLEKVMAELTLNEKPSR